MNKILAKFKVLSKTQKWSLSICSIICAIALFNLNSCSNEHNNEETQLDSFYKVTRGNFDITVLGRGELAAIKNYQLRFEGKGKQGLNIIQIVENQSKVTAGDPVVSFSDELYLERIKNTEEAIYDLQTDYENALIFEADLFSNKIRDLEEKLDDIELNIVLFLETLGVARDKTISELTVLANSHDTAVDALGKYQNLEYRSESKKKQVSVADEEQTYYSALDAFERSKEELSEARLKDDDTRDKATRAVSIADKKVATSMDSWENARKAERRFRRYDHPQKLKRLIIARDNALLNLKRRLVKAESDRVQADRRYRKYLRQKEQAENLIIERRVKQKEKLTTMKEEFKEQEKRSTENLEELKNDYSMLVLRAPISGIVELGGKVRRGKDPKVLTIGTKIAPKEVVARIPDLSQFLVRCDVPEIYRSRLKVGLSAILRNAALPDLIMKGKIDTISSMSERLNRWDSRSPKVYTTTISTNSTDERLMPGMTVEVEVRVDTVNDVLYVPVEALYNMDGKTYCSVQGTFEVEERSVETGRVSTSFVEIISGLKEGETLLLHQDGVPAKADQ